MRGYNQFAEEMKIGEARGWPRTRTGAVWTWTRVLAAIGSGVSVLFGAAVVLTTLFGGGMYGNEIKLNGGSQLFYTSSVKESEASPLAHWLNVYVLLDLKNPLPVSSPRSFQLSKKGSVYELRVCVQPGVEKNKEIVSAWRTASSLMSEEVFGKARVDVILCDEHLNTRLAVPHEDAKPATQS
jgi:hypothetical protein